MSDTAPRPTWRENLVPLIAALVAAVAAIAFRGELIRWFTGAGHPVATGRESAAARPSHRDVIRAELDWATGAKVGGER